jgi:hypothetical protein
LEPSYHILAAIDVIITGSLLLWRRGYDGVNDGVKPRDGVMMGSSLVVPISLYHDGVKPRSSNFALNWNWSGRPRELPP